MTKNKKLFNTIDKTVNEYMDNIRKTDNINFTNNLYEIKGGFVIVLLDTEGQLINCITLNIKNKNRKHELLSENLNRSLRRISDQLADCLGIDRLYVIDSFSYVLYDNKHYNEDVYLTKYYKSKIINRYTGKSDDIEDTDLMFYRVFDSYTDSEYFFLDINEAKLKYNELLNIQKERY